MDQPVNRPVVQPVVTGARVMKPKETFGHKLKNAFIAPGVDNVGQYLVDDIVIPSIRNTLLTAGISMLYYLFQGRKTPVNNGGMGFSNPYIGTPFWNPLSRVGTPTNTVNYSGQTSQTMTTPQQQPQMKIPTKPTDVLIPDRGKAQLALDAVTDVMKTYGYCTVGTFFEIVGVPTNGYPDYEYGWKDLYGVSIKQGMGGFYIDMPRAVKVP